MRRALGPLILALAAAAPAQAAVEKAPLTVTNTSQRIADCAVLIDGRIKYYVKIRPGRTWSDDFQTMRELKLVCERSRKLFFGPLRLGGAYEITEVRGKLEIAESGAPPSA
jgi:hypothetical protein